VADEEPAYFQAACGQKRAEHDVVAVACVDLFAGLSDSRDIIGTWKQLRAWKLQVRAVAPVGTVTHRIASDEIIAHRFIEHPRQCGDRVLECGSGVRCLPSVDGPID